MRYKLSDKLNAFLNDNVLSNYRGALERKIVFPFEKDSNLFLNTITIDSQNATYGLTLTVTVTREDLEEIEPLKPYVWYPCEKFDGNPKDYPLVESTGETYCCTYKLGSKTLYSTTKHFMYIELC